MYPTKKSYMNIIFQPNTPESIKEKIISDWDTHYLPTPFSEIDKVTDLCKQEILNNDELNNYSWYREKVFPIYLNILKSENVENFVAFLANFFEIEKKEVFEYGKYKVFISNYLGIKTSNNQAYLYVCNHDRIIEGMVQYSYFGHKLIYFLDHLGLAWMDGEYHMYTYRLFWHLGNINSLIDAKIALVYTVPDIARDLKYIAEGTYNNDNRPPEIEINFSNGELFNKKERLDFVANELLSFVKSNPELKIFSHDPDYSSSFHFLSNFIEDKESYNPILGEHIVIFKYNHPSSPKEELYFLYDSENKKNLTIGMDLTTFVVLLLKYNEYYILRYFLILYNSPELETSFDTYFTEQEKNLYYQNYFIKKAIETAKKNSQITAKISEFIIEKINIDEDLESFVKEVAPNVFNSISKLENYQDNGFIKLEKNSHLVFESLKKDICNIKYAHSSLTKDKAFILQVISICDENYLLEVIIKFISKPLLKDKDVVIALAKCDGYLALKYAHPSFRKNKEVVLEAVNSNGYALRYTHPSLRKNRTIILKAAANFEDDYWDYDNMKPLIYYIDASFKKDEEIVWIFLDRFLSGFNYVDSILRKDKEFVLKCVETRGMSLEYAHISLKKDKKIVLNAISNAPLALQFAHKSLRKDKEICLAALTEIEQENNVIIRNISDGEQHVFEFIDDSLKNDREFIKIVINHIDEPSYIFQFVGKSLMKDKDFVFEIIKLFQKRERADLLYFYSFIDETLQADYEIAIEILKSTNCTDYFFEIMPNSLKKDRKFILEAIKLKVHLGYINKFWWTDRAFVMEAQEFLPKEYFNNVLEKINTIESIKKNLNI
jgi:hypothetical protein